MKHRHFLLLTIALVYISGFFILDRWKTTLYYGDSNSYYLHLVSFFIYRDVGDYDKSIASLREINPDSPDPREDPFGIRLTEKGRRYIKYTLGVPFMEAPFFLLAHVYAKLTGAFPANGWSLPYLLAVGLSTICYVLTGFHLLIKILEKHFPKKTTAYVVLAIALATNLFYHSTYVTMAHGFLFFDYCLLLYLTEKFYERPGRWKALGIGVVVGLITLTRVPEIISALIPLLWGVVSWVELRARRNFFVKNYYSLLLAAIGFLGIFSIQFVYWHYVSGQLIFNPYQGERFNFLKPRIHKGWFHFANGWLIYTPIMGFGLLGLFFLRRYFPVPLPAILAFVGLHAYIHYSYYVWTYFPGLGSRPMVETYPLLSFGLAACFMYFFNNKWLSWLPVVSLAFFTWLNLFQTWQMKRGIIWTERGSWAFYYETFGALEFSQNALRAFDTNQMQPDSSDLTFIKTLVYEGFEDFNHQSVDSSLPHRGNHSFLTTEEFTSLKNRVSLSDVQPGDWLRIGLYAFMREADRVWNRDHCAMLFVELFDEKGVKKKGIHLRISSHVGNENYSIWSAGEPGQWGEASFFLRAPRHVNAAWHLNIHIKNPHGQNLYLDDLRIDHYRPL
jgi:hypothetical protein